MKTIMKKPLKVLLLKSTQCYKITQPETIIWNFFYKKHLKLESD